MPRLTAVLLLTAIFSGSAQAKDVKGLARVVDGDALWLWQVKIA